MTIEDEISDFFNGIQEFSSLLKEKGYDGIFNTNAVCRDNLEASLKKYMYASMLGLESGMAEPIRLVTSLEWKGGNMEEVVVHFKVCLNQQNKLTVKEMEVMRQSSQYIGIQKATIKIKSFKQIPSKADAIKMVGPTVKLKPYRRIKR